MAEKRRYGVATVNGTHINIPILKIKEVVIDIKKDSE